MRIRTISALTPALLLGILLPTSTASACGVSVAPTFTITDVWPADGMAEVPPDSGIVVNTLASSEPGGPDVPVSVILIDEATGAEVSGRSIQWFSESPTLAWQPDEPLLASHSYRIEATVLDVEGNSTGEEVVTNFATGEVNHDELEFSGEISVVLEAFDEEILDCSGCGEPCLVVATQPALRARVALPAVSGGQGLDTRYRARLHYTNDTPKVSKPSDFEGFNEVKGEHEFNHYTFLELDVEEQLTVEQKIYERDFEYAPCFTFIVWDAGGHRAETSLCLDALSPQEVRSLAGIEDDKPDTPEEPTAPDDSEPEDTPRMDDPVEDSMADFPIDDASLPLTSTEPPEPSREGGCSFSLSSSRNTPTGLLLLVGWLTLLRLRARERNAATTTDQLRG